MTELTPGLFADEYRASLFTPGQTLYNVFYLVIRRVYADWTYTVQWTISDSNYMPHAFLGRDGQWWVRSDYVLEDRAKFLAATRFDDPEEAFEVARKHLPDMVVNGRTAQQAQDSGFGG